MLTDLIGVKAKEVRAEFFNSVKAGMSLLNKDKAATAADDCGAINIYIDDEGLFRGYRYYYFGERSFIVTMKKLELKQWLTENLPKIRRR